MHGGGVSQRDVLGEVVALEHGAGVVGESFGGKPIGLGVDGGDAPAVAVADLVDAVAAGGSGRACTSMVVSLLRLMTTSPTRIC